MGMYMKWITLHVADLEASKRFYGQFLGLKEQKTFSPAHGRTICFFDTNSSVQMELICDKSAGKTASPSTFCMGFGVDDFDEMYHKSKECGIVLSEPVVMGGNMHCFFISDPDGMKLQIIKNE